MRWLPETFIRGDRSIRRDWIAYTLALPIVDAIAAAIALAIAYRAPVGADLLSPERYIALSALVMMAWLGLLGGFGLYSRERLLGGADEFGRLFQAAAILPVALAFFDFLFGATLMSREWLISFWPSLVVFSGAGRMSARRTAHAARRWGAFRSRVIIVGVDERAVQFAQHLTATGYRVLGFFDDYRPSGWQVGEGAPGEGGWPVLGDAHDLSRAAELGADEVIVVPSAVSWESRRASLGSDAARRFDVRILADREDALTGHIHVSQRAGVPVYALQETRLSGFEAVIKRGFDVVVAGVLIASAGPFALRRIIACLVARRPVFERHTLLGARGKPIVVHTLCGGGNRIVSKLPAVFAVLRGHMSIVGPVGMSDDIAVTPPELWTMKPGLTSAVWGDRRSVDEASVTAIQTEYVRNYSIWSDLQVIWHRVLALGRSGKQAVNAAAFWDVYAYGGKRLEEKV
jgi:lipopolysaccharide/colanic/teichoic acid biosynthesis glycosyltransferase